MGIKVQCHNCERPLIVGNVLTTDTGFEHVYARDNEYCHEPIPFAVMEAVARKARYIESLYATEIEYLQKTNRQILEDLRWCITKCVPIKGTDSDQIAHFWGLVEQYLLTETP